METSPPSTTMPTDVLVKQFGAVSFAQTHRDMLELQRQLGTAPSGTIEQHRRETLFLFEPSPVVTLGSAATSRDILIDEDLLRARGIDIHQVDHLVDVIRYWLEGQAGGHHWPVAAISRAADLASGRRNDMLPVDWCRSCLESRFA